MYSINIIIVVNHERLTGTLFNAQLNDVCNCPENYAVLLYRITKMIFQYTPFFEHPVNCFMTGSAVLLHYSKCSIRPTWSFKDLVVSMISSVYNDFFTCL